MKHPSLPVKRRSVKKGALSTLFVNVVRKRHRASTSAPAMPEMEGDVPNVGVARALVVILAIHVVAIAGLFIHSRYFETKTESTGSKLSVVPGRQEDNKNQIKLGEGEKGHLISGGESYADIAREEGVDVKALQEANNNVELRAGNFLRLPAKQIVAVEPAIIAATRDSADSSQTNSLVSSPASTPSSVTHDTLRESPPMVEANTGAKPPRAVLVKPMGSRDNDSGSNRTAEKPKDKEKPVATSRPKEAKAVAQSAAAPAKKSASKMTVKSGDTLWSIAKANGTTPAALMKANGIKDASKMRTGMELTIPKN